MCRGEACQFLGRFNRALVPLAHSAPLTRHVHTSYKLMKRRHNPSDLPGVPSEEPSETKRPKLTEDASNAAETASNGSKLEEELSDNRRKVPSSPMSAIDSESSSTTPMSRSPTPQSMTPRSGRQTRAAKNKASAIKKGRADTKSPADAQAEWNAVLQIVPKYVDWVLLPGTTFTIHRKEFIREELRYTSKVMATKLASKVSRAIKRGDYTPRSQLPPKAPLQRPLRLAEDKKPYPETLHPVALLLKENKKEPPRPISA